MNRNLEIICWSKGTLTLSFMNRNLEIICWSKGTLTLSSEKFKAATLLRPENQRMVFQIILCCFKEFCNFREGLKSIICNPFPFLAFLSYCLHWQLLPCHTWTILHEKKQTPPSSAIPSYKFDAILVSANNLPVLHVFWVTTRSSKSRSIFNSFIHF